MNEKATHDPTESNSYLRRLTISELCAVEARAFRGDDRYRIAAVRDEIRRRKRAGEHRQERTA